MDTYSDVAKLLKSGGEPTAKVLDILDAPWASKLMQAAGAAGGLAAAGIELGRVLNGEKSPEEKIIDAIADLSQDIKDVEQSLTLKLDDAVQDLKLEYAATQVFGYVEVLEIAQERLAAAVLLAQDALETDGDLERAVIGPRQFRRFVKSFGPDGAEKLFAAIHGLCNFSQQYLKRLYEFHSYSAPKVASDGERLRALIVSGIIIYPLLSVPSAGAEGQQSEDSVPPEDDQVMQTNLHNLNEKYIRFVGSLEYYLTKAVIDEDSNIRAILDKKLPTLDPKWTFDEAACNLLDGWQKKKKGDGFQGLATIWPWLDFVVFVYNRQRTVCYPPLGTAGQQWQTYTATTKSTGYDWFVAWSTRSSMSSLDRDMLSEYRFNCSPQLVSADGDRAPQTPAELSSSGRKLSGTPKEGFDPAARTRMEAELLTFSQMLDPYEISRRFPGQMKAAKVAPGCAFLAHWDSSGGSEYVPNAKYGLTFAEMKKIRDLGVDDVGRQFLPWTGFSRKNVDDRYGFLVGEKNYGVALTSESRVVLWGPRVLRRQGSIGLQVNTQVGVALVLA